MENIIIWAGTIILVFIILLPYLLKHSRLQKNDFIRKKEAERLGADKAIAQHPQIDSFKCIGCGSCVEACPEGDVLGIVFGKATIINGLKCVGHGLCAEACPVEGITIGLGEISNRDDIPVMDKNHQTNIPGIYIAGELGGLALIKNAISQGAKVVQHIVENINPSSNNLIKDIIIIGAGPAGLSAALNARKNNLSYTLLDHQGIGGTILQYPRKKLVMTKPIEIPLYGPLDKPEYKKEELLEIWQEIQERFAVEPLIGEKLQEIKMENDHFDVITQTTSYKSQTVVLALGRRGTPRKLNVPGEDQAKVMYKLIDAESYQNNHVLVAGGGDSAIEAAIGLARQQGNVVSLSYRKEKFFRIKTRNEERINELLNDNKLQVIFNSTIESIGEKEVIINQRDKKTNLKNDYVFIFAGGEPPFALLKKCGIQFGK